MTDVRLSIPDLKEGIREAMAEAWDQGFDKGFYDPLAGRDPQRDASESTATNPYRSSDD